MRTRLWLSAVVLTLCLVPASGARGAAYYLGEIGTRSLARGGANIVNPGDPSAVWLNPAAVALSHGVQLQLNNSFVFMDGRFTRDCGPTGLCGPRTVNRQYGGYGYSVDGDGRPEANDDELYAVHTPDARTLGRYQTPSQFDDRHTVQNQAPFQYIPAFFATANLDSIGLDGFAGGIGVFGPNAGDYSFPADETTRYTLIDRDLLEAFYMATIAYRYKNWLAVGASLQGVSGGLTQTQSEVRGQVAIGETADPVRAEESSHRRDDRISAWRTEAPCGPSSDRPSCARSRARRGSADRPSSGPGGWPRRRRRSGSGPRRGAGRRPDR